MKTRIGVLAAILVFCCAAVFGPASQARAAEECTTQGALALALAEVLGLKVTVAQEAADALAQLGVAPQLGWNVEACLTNAVSREVAQSFAALNREAGGFERAMGMIGPIPDQATPTVSPFKP